MAKYKPKCVQPEVVLCTRACILPSSLIRTMLDPISNMQLYLFFFYPEASFTGKLFSSVKHTVMYIHIYNFIQFYTILYNFIQFYTILYNFIQFYEKKM